VAKYIRQEGSALGGDQRKQLTKNLGYRTLYEINYSNTILLTPIVGTILLTRYGRGMRFEELVKKSKLVKKGSIGQRWKSEATNRG